MKVVCKLRYSLPCSPFQEEHVSGTSAISKMGKGAEGWGKVLTQSLIVLKLDVQKGSCRKGQMVSPC
jgi:hypothetical protein